MKRHTFLPRLAAIAALLLAAASFTSCEDDESTLGIDLVDPATLYAPKYDTLYPEMLASYDSLLASYSLTREDFERSIDWYTRHPQIYQRIHDTVLARFDRQLEELSTE